MRFLIAAVLLLPVPALADVVATPPSRTCAVDIRVLPAAMFDGFQRLDRLPPASEFLAVYRAVGGCPTPIIVASRIGAPRR